jgi:hypothetical protein
VIRPVRRSSSAHARHPAKSGATVAGVRAGVLAIGLGGSGAAGSDAVSWTVHPAVTSIVSMISLRRSMNGTKFCAVLWGFAGQLPTASGSMRADTKA